MPPLRLLKPYRSLILGTTQGRRVTPSDVRKVVADLHEILELSDHSPRRFVSQVPYVSYEGLLVGNLHYAEERTPPWTTDTSVLNVTNHLALVAAKHSFVAIFLSESSRKAIVLSQLGLDPARGLGLFVPLQQGIVNAAFVQGPTRTLWLSGTHRRTSVSADNKVLTGLDLRDALDPLSDQTYHFTAARCTPTIGGRGTTVGVSPRSSAIWAGRSPSWADFAVAVSAVLDHLRSTTRPDHAPLPILAVSTTTPSAVNGPFDIAFVPPELLGDPTVDADDAQTIEKWGYGSKFEVASHSGDNLTAQVYLGGELLGEIDIAVDVATPARVGIQARGRPASPATSGQLDEAVQLASRVSWVKIWYESGHTISNGAVYEIRHRDIPFRGFQWADLTGYDVKKEKALPIGQLGSQDSLFDWTVRHWPNLDRTRRRPQAWIALDDHSMETADFIAFDDTATPPILSLIHVKSSGSREPARAVSVSDYEVVASQAIKNLRYLDTRHLANKLKGAVQKSISTRVWHNGAASTRTAMLSAIASAGTNYQSRVVILQPRLTRTRHDRSRARQQSADMARLRQLDTLLVSAEATCHGLGADLIVIGEETIPGQR